MFQLGRLVELLIIMVVALVPMYWLATDVNRDEYLKSGWGVGLGLSYMAVSRTVVFMYREWKRGS